MRCPYYHDKEVRVWFREHFTQFHRNHRPLPPTWNNRQFCKEFGDQVIDATAEWYEAIKYAQPDSTGLSMVENKNLVWTPSDRGDKDKKKEPGEPGKITMVDENHTAIQQAGEGRSGGMVLITVIILVVLVYAVIEPADTQATSPARALYEADIQKYRMLLKKNPCCIDQGQIDCPDFSECITWTTNANKKFVEPSYLATFAQIPEYFTWGSWFKILTFGCVALVLYVALTSLCKI